MKVAHCEPQIILFSLLQTIYIRNTKVQYSQRSKPYLLYLLPQQSVFNPIYPKSFLTFAKLITYPFNCYELSGKPRGQFRFVRKKTVLRSHKVNSEPSLYSLGLQVFNSITNKQDRNYSFKKPTSYNIT